MQKEQERLAQRAGSREPPPSTTPLEQQQQDQQQQEEHQLGEEEAAALRALQGYLTSVTAKDCGIIITLQRVVWCGEGPEPEVGETECMGEPRAAFVAQQQAAQLEQHLQQHQQHHQQQQQQQQQGMPESNNNSHSKPLFPSQQQAQQHSHHTQQDTECDDEECVARHAERSGHLLRRPYSLLKLALPGMSGNQVAWFKYKVFGVIELASSVTMCHRNQRGCL